MSCYETEKSEGAAPGWLRSPPSGGAASAQTRLRREPARANCFIPFWFLIKVTSPQHLRAIRTESSSSYPTNGGGSTHYQKYCLIVFSVSKYCFSFWLLLSNCISVIGLIIIFNFIEMVLSVINIKKKFSVEFLWILHCSCFYYLFCQKFTVKFFCM